MGGFGGHNLVFLEVFSQRQLCRRFGAGCFVGIARKGVSIDSVLSHLDQSDDDNVELKIKTKVNSNCKIISFSLLRIKVEMASNDEANTPSCLMGLIGRRTSPSTD